MDLNEEIRRRVDEAPPLSDSQRNRIAALLRPTLGSSAHYVPPRVKVHYDADDVVMFTGEASTDLLRHVELTYVRRTEMHEEGEARELGRDAVFMTVGPATVGYLIKHDDLSWVMPVQHLDRSAEVIPQISPGRYWK